MASVFAVIGMVPVAQLIKIGGKLLFKKQQGGGELQHFQKHLQSSLPELRQNIIEEVRETYANIATKLEEEIEKGYQQDRTASLAALERAQAVKSSGEVEFANADAICNEISALLAETCAEVERLEKRIFPSAPEEATAGIAVV